MQNSDKGTPQNKRDESARTFEGLGERNSMQDINKNSIEQNSSPTLRQKATTQSKIVTDVDSKVIN